MAIHQLSPAVDVWCHITLGYVTLNSTVLFLDGLPNGQCYTTPHPHP